MFTLNIIETKEIEISLDDIIRECGDLHVGPHYKKDSGYYANFGGGSDWKGSGHGWTPQDAIKEAYLIATRRLSHSIRRVEEFGMVDILSGLDDEIMEACDCDDCCDM